MNWTKQLDRKMIRTIMTLAWPTMLEQLMQTAVQYIDTAMVGSLGTNAMAAVGATTTVGWLIGGMVSAWGVGFLSFIAQACGAGDKNAAAKAVAQAVIVTVGGVYITVVLWKHPMISPRGQKFRPDWSILKPTLRVAIPNMFQRFGTSLGYVAFAAMINALGEVATSAHTVANTVESLFYIPGYGMQAAAATLAGNAYGAKDAQRMKKLARMFIPIEVGLMIISGGLLFLFAPPLVKLFSADAAVISLGTTVLRMVAVSEPFYGFSIIVEGMMQGVGRTKLPFIFNVAGMWAVRIVGTYICTNFFGMGQVSAWACMIAHNSLLFGLFLWCYVRGTWNPLQHLE